MPIKWDDSYSVGIEEIDNQHKKIIKIINQVLEIIEEESLDDNLKTIIKELIDYSNYHFKFEEDYFEKFNYEDKDSHLEKHGEFRAQLMKISQEFQDDKMEAAYQIIDFLENWLIDHINGTDKRYIECFQENGL